MTFCLRRIVKIKNICKLVLGIINAFLPKRDSHQTFGLVLLLIWALREITCTSLEGDVNVQEMLEASIFNEQ